MRDRLRTAEERRSLRNHCSEHRPPLDAAKLRELIAEGIERRFIAERFGCSVDAIREFLKRNPEEKSDA